MQKKNWTLQLLGLCFALLVGTSANAAPLLYLNEIVQLENGFTSYDFWIDSNDLGQNSPYGNYNGARTMAINLTFTGLSVAQSKAYGMINVDSASDARTWAADSNSGYKIVYDSYYYDDIWTPLLHQPSSTGNSFYLHLATQPGGIFNSGHLVRIVTSGGLTVNGTIARFGTNYTIAHEFVSMPYDAPHNTGGLVLAPEPSTATLLGVGLLGLLSLRTRRKKHFAKEKLNL